MGEINQKTFAMINSKNKPLIEEPFIEDFTVEHYRNLFQIARANYQFVTYESIPTGESFILWRHDCDFSLNRSLELAKIESEEGVICTYFINLHSEFYNTLEKAQSEIIRQIIKLGHSIGLHFDAEYHEISCEAELEALIAYEASILEGYFGAKPTAFSFHNPNEVCLAYEKEKYGGLVNCYSKKFKEEIPYCSDSNGYWRFRRLFDVLEKAEDPCLQVLTHPAWWQYRPMLPMERIDRSISGRAMAIRNFYIQNMDQMGRKNIGI